MPSTVTVHRAPVLLPVSGPPVADGAVAVRGGVVVAAGAHHEVVSGLETGFEQIEWQGTIAPGLVNAHTHLQYSDMAAVGLGRYDGFEHWSHAFQEAYERPHDWAASAASGAAEALRWGTTALADIVTDPAAGGALHDAGLHGIVYWEVFNWKAGRWDAEGRARVTEALGRIPAPPATGLSPHAVYSLDTDVLHDLVEFAAELGLRQHIHAAEAASEDEFTRTGTGTLAEQWRQYGHADLQLLAGGGSGLGAISYLDRAGALTPSTHLAHGIYVDADDRALLRRRGVTVALCPRSNAVIGLDPPPVAAYLAEGNALAVGTDSLSSSPSLNPLADVAALHLLARAQGYREADLHERLLEAVTLGGARALGLEGSTGHLTPGARADFAVFDTASPDPLDARAELVETGSTPVTATHVDGALLWSSTAGHAKESTHA
ncbi:amidohydrolase family protein [Herbiconiux moechotypicola]|uniref:Amidohydrolase family protein n=1 Tax=Herbiconiux moechotypicola TaxID=637393 RepID=A0ABN3D8U4_9MICO|nr:amidohydrolase family protein [Herbiconiux moechotypicola]MCS5728186.1 amidohydrolase family protein [Herbiconiux moechotypicola]